MSVSSASASEIVSRLEALASDEELAKVRKRLAPDEAAFGLRMRDLFDVAKAYTDVSLDEVDRLLDHPAYEPRMAAMCILDFRARRRLDEDQRRDLHELYLGRHEAITTWDMVDRSAPRVVGGYLAGRSATPLHDLAMAPQALRRRTAITAPLYFIWAGSEEDLAEGFVIAARLAADPDPAVYKPVGTFLKHAGTRDPAALHRFLTEHAAAMRRPALRIAVDKLDPTERRRYLA
jgi:3-methyladenine DNA glycosylase AlkD